MALPFEAIDRYAQRFGPHKADDFAEFLELIGALDSEYLKIAAERQKQEDK